MVFPRDPPFDLWRPSRPGHILTVGVWRKFSLATRGVASSTIVTPKHDADLLRSELYSSRSRRIGGRENATGDSRMGCRTIAVSIFSDSASSPPQDRLQARLAVDAAMMATAAAPPYHQAPPDRRGCRSARRRRMGQQPIALAVVEAVTLLDWPASSLRVLDLWARQRGDRRGLVGAVSQKDDPPVHGRPVAWALGIWKLLYRPSIRT